MRGCSSWRLVRCFVRVGDSCCLAVDSSEPLVVDSQGMFWEPELVWGMRECNGWRLVRCFVRVGDSHCLAVDSSEPLVVDSQGNSALVLWWALQFLHRLLHRDWATLELANML